MDYNARYYSPYLGRFVSPDTIVPNPLDSQHFNRYTYAYGNPVKFVDPNGHCGISSETEKMLIDAGCSADSHEDITLHAGPATNITLRGNGYAGRPPFDSTAEYYAEVGAKITDISEFVVSAIGVIGRGPASYGGSVGLKLEGAYFDQYENITGGMNMASNIASYVFGGRSYIDWTTQEIVLGQNTLTTLADQFIDTTTLVHRGVNSTRVRRRELYPCKST